MVGFGISNVESSSLATIVFSARNISSSLGNSFDVYSPLLYIEFVP
jgi:hypothetical protein